VMLFWKSVILEYYVKSKHLMSSVCR